MKIYMGAIINDATGAIDHCITSSEPIPDEQLPVPHPGSYTVKRFKFENAKDAGFVRAREAMYSIEIKDASITLKTTTDATRFDKFVEVQAFETIETR